VPDVAYAGGLDAPKGELGVGGMPVPIGLGRGGRRPPGVYLYPAS
jgi:hypothetical protein